MNAWHYVTITHEATDVDGVNEYKWTNSANVSWSLFQNPTDPTLFDVGEECPYFDWGDNDAANFMTTEMFLDQDG